MKRIIIISICLAIVLSASTIPMAQEKMGKEMTFEEFEKKIKNRILKRNKKLEDLFRKEAYEEMAATFSDYSTITTHERAKIPAKESAPYWASLGKMEATNLQFTLKSFYGWELKLSEENHPEETNFVVFEITKFSFNVGSNGEEDPEGEEGSGSRHRVKCIED